MIVARHFVAISLFAVCFAVPAYGAPTAVVKKPSMACPRTALGDSDLQSRYDLMWEHFAREVEEVSNTLRTEVESQSKSATSSGNLDLALFWKGLEKNLKERGELQWDEPTLKKGWSGRFGGSSFPADFTVAVKRASEAYKLAQQGLENGYGEVVAEFTKAEKLDQALKIRGELKQLLAAENPAPPPKPKPVPKPEPKPKPAPAYLSSMQPFEKRLQMGWFEVGSVWKVPINHGGRRGERSIFLHAQPDGFSAVKYRFAPDFDYFESGVFVPKVKEEQGNPATPLIFEVWGDGRLLWRSQPVATMNQMQACRVGVKGVTTLELRVVCPGRDNWAVAVWFEPCVLKDR